MLASTAYWVNIINAHSPNSPQPSTSTADTTAGSELSFVVMTIVIVDAGTPFGNGNGVFAETTISCKISIVF